MTRMQLPTLEHKPLPDRSTGPDVARQEGSAVIEIEALSMIYAQRIAALKQVTLRIAQGERVAIVGDSGSGKTTLLGCMTGRLTATEGTVRVEGRIATIHQDLRLVRQRTALANVLHGAMGRMPCYRTCLPFPRCERDQAVRLLQRVGMGHRIHARVGTLSGGEQQRVAIARALMQQPQVLLADEPVASLDPRNAGDIMQLLADLAKERRLTVVCVLHDHELAQRFAQRAIALDQGRVIFDGPVRETRPLAECCACAPEEINGLNHCSIEHCIKYQPDKAGSLHRLRYWSAAALAGVLAVAVYVWAFMGLGIQPRQLERAGTEMARFLASMIPGSMAEVQAIPWAEISWSLVQTIQMSIIGTTLGVLIAWPMAALAARNVGPAGVRYVMRFILNTIRTIPSLIWALFFLAAVGFGSLAGVFALAAYSLGYLTKFFYEAFEAVDPGPPDALKEIGANGPQRFWHAVWPAARPAILSSSLFMLEYNVRAASVLGIVGAGGIGFYFKHFYDHRMFPAMLACLIMLLVVVVILDAVSNRIRARLVQN